jgi:hypothetical protein
MGMKLILTLRENHFLSSSGMGLSPLVLRLQTGPLYKPWMTDERMKHCCDDNWQGEIKVFGENPAPMALCPV